MQIASELNVEILEMQTDKDHIHILADIDSSCAVNEIYTHSKR